MAGLLRREFDVFPKQTFFSWTALADTMDLIAALKVEWMFAGHGMWHEVSAEEWERQMPVLGQAMRDVGLAAWSRRPDTTYGWY